MTLEQIGAKLLAAPKVRHGLIQRQLILAATKGPRVPGGADQFIETHSYEAGFRVVIGDEKRTLDHSHPDLMVAARMAFDGLRIPLPAGLPDTFAPEFSPLCAPIKTGDQKRR